MNKIKLNAPCPVCKKPIYLGDETAHTKKGVYHLSCYVKEEIIFKNFNFELNSDTLSYHTLEKLREIIGGKK